MTDPAHSASLGNLHLGEKNLIQDDGEKNASKFFFRQGRGEYSEALRSELVNHGEKRLKIVTRRPKFL